MGVITDIDIVSAGKGTCKLSWTGTAGEDAWVYVNGVLFDGPISFSGTDRTREIPFDSEDVFCLVLIETTSGDYTDSLNPVPATNPTFSWSAVADAVNYKIYGQETDDGDESQIDEIAGDDRHGRYVWKTRESQNATNGVWHFYRIESVDDNENESTSSSFSVYLKGLPDTLSEMELTGSAGSFDLTLTE